MLSSTVPIVCFPALAGSCFSLAAALGSGAFAALAPACSPAFGFSAFPISGMQLVNAMLPITSPAALMRKVFLSAVMQLSEAGALLFKLLIAVALVLIVGHRQIALITLPSAVIVGREIVISALREWMAEAGKRASVAVSIVGKVKTVVQMIAILFLLAYNPRQSGAEIIYIIGALLLYVAAVLTIWSMCIYMRAAWLEMKGR